MNSAVTLYVRNRLGVVTLAAAHRETATAQAHAHHSHVADSGAAPLTATELELAVPNAEILLLPSNRYSLAGPKPDLNQGYSGGRAQFRFNIVSVEKTFLLRQIAEI